MVQSHNSGATKKTVLVVDDSTTMRSMVQSFLSQEEYHVQVAKSGQEGLARIQEHCPDILLLDFIMPGMNGYEVYTRLREQPEYTDLPIVIMSGSKVEVFNKFAESKAEQKFVFLSKPFDPETLKKQISLALELRLIPTAIEDISSGEEVHLEQALSHKPALVEEAPAVVQEEVAVSPESLLTNEVMVHGAITVPSVPSYEVVEIPMAQIPLENSNLDYFHQLPEELNLENETVYSSAQESAEQVPIEAHYSALEPIHIEPAEKTLVAQTNEETAEISKPQVSTEDMGINYIHQNLAHILETETYVMSALRNLDERTAEDIRSIRSLADDTNRLQEEFIYVRGVLNDLTELPKQLENLKEQVLSQPQVAQVYLDKTEQEHLTIVGDRFNSVDAVLMQSVVTLDRLEEIQAGLGETIHTSYGQLADRLTVIERRFEAIIVRPPDPIPVPVVSSPAKRNIPPLLYITIALGALNFGAMVALLMR